MSLLAPGALFLFGLLPVIVLLYLLKLRRTERLISSTYLWRRMVRDIEANAPWQKLRFNILLLLQILFLIALILALARPVSKAGGFTSRSAIFIIDISASMAAVDVSPSRLEAAKSQARRWVDDMPDDAVLTLIAAGRSARVIVSQTTDPRRMHQAIESLQPQAGVADLAVALQLASAIAARQPDTRVIVLSDGGVSIPNRIAIPATVEYSPIGLQEDNQAISLLNLEKSSDAGLTAFAQVTNYGKETVRRRIAFYADNLLIDAFDLEIPPGDSRPVLVERIAPDTQVVEAHLLAGEGYRDYLALDDRAAVVFQPTEPISITLISAGNLFLETALSVIPAVEVTRLNPAGLGGYPQADITIFDGAYPITPTLPSNNLLFVGPITSTEFFTITGRLLAPRPIPAPDDHPILRYADLSAVSILDSAQIPLPDWAAPVVLAEDPTVSLRSQPPLIFAGERSGRRIAVIGFDLRRTDLTLQNAFPLMMLNLVDWLVPTRSGALPQSVAPGEVLKYSAGAGELPSSIRLVRPDGSSTMLSAVNGELTISDTDRLGVHRLEFGADHPNRMYAVNLFSPQESKIAPSESLPIDSSASSGAALRLQQASREWWRWLAFLALLLLLIEWLVYHRSALSRLIHHT